MDCKSRHLDLVTVWDFLFCLTTQRKSPNLDPGKCRQNTMKKSHGPSFS